MVTGPDSGEEEVQRGRVHLDEEGTWKGDEMGHGGKGANIVGLGYRCVVRFECRLISIPTYVFYLSFALRCWTECLFGRPGSLDLRSLSTKERTIIVLNILNTERGGGTICPALSAMSFMKK